MLKRRQNRIEKGIDCNKIYGSPETFSGDDIVGKIKMQIDTKIIIDNFSRK